MIRKHGHWKLVRVKDVSMHPGLNDVFLFSHGLVNKFIFVWVYEWENNVYKK